MEIPPRRRLPTPPIAVGLRLPLATEPIGPGGLLEICRAAVGLGFSSFWLPDHVLLPASTDSPHPYSPGGEPPFRPQAPFADPLLELTWLAAQLPEARFGTSVLILGLRNPVLLAHQLSTMSWLTARPFGFGVGSGWLREEYEAVGMPFERRATRAKRDIRHIRHLLSGASRAYTVRDVDGEEEERAFAMRPAAPAPIEFLWGGVSPIALRLVATVCDGWLPSKQGFEDLESRLRDLRAICEEVERPFEDLKIVAKVGPGIDPADGRVDAENLARYRELGVDEIIVELPYEPEGPSEAIAALERVAGRSWL